MEFFFGWIVFSALAGWIASQKRRGFAGVFFLSLVLSPLVGIIVALVLKPAATPEEVARATEEAVTPRTHVRCPDCAELVRREAKVCKHCGAKLVPQLWEPPKIVRDGLWFKCPCCANRVTADTLVCSYCQADLAPPEPVPVDPATVLK